MYWLNLYGWLETKQSSETVRIPILQVLDVESLRQLMDDSRQGRLPVRTFLKDEHLLAVTPNALSAYVNSRNWAKAGEHGEYSDVYEGRACRPLSFQNGRDWGLRPGGCPRLLDIFSRVEEAPVGTVYSDLLYADRDVIRVRVNEGGRETLPLGNVAWNS